MAPPRMKKMAAMFSGPGDKKNMGKHVARVLFSNVGLFFLVAIYAAGGAYIYMLLERDNEAKLKEIKRLTVLDAEDSKKYIISLLWYQNSQNLSKNDFNKMVTANLQAFNDFVVTNAQDADLQFDGLIDTWSYDWTFPNALLFTVSSIAVIGYGNVVPKTFNGRSFTILYNVIGIPLLLVFLANIGDFLASSCRYIYSRLCCRWCRARRRFSELRKGKTLEKHAVWREDVGYEPYMPTGKVEVPIMVNLVMITVYVLLCGLLFRQSEEWDMISAVYFTFITLSTIGFGDLVPGKAFSNSGNQFASGIRMLATVLVTLFGMALLSMCINLMQEQMVKKIQYMMTALGLKDEDIDPMEKYKYKKSEMGTVVETHKDRDGNKRLSLMNTNEGESTASKPPTYSNIKEELEDA
ncbi:TWiK family of potassium channels protein 7 isoform X2 [Procambarus clarkii]|uniref:TWiK family of potassium channels protein 7 isoform X2 n=1 Tax=Procambarus clarkii TaxID=6728 RepID=UPI003743FCCE